MKNRISKNEWVSMFAETGLDEAVMKRWHHIFETRHPDAHADFLEWLGIGPDEIDRIRAASR